MSQMSHFGKSNEWHSQFNTCCAPFLYCVLMWSWLLLETNAALSFSLEVRHFSCCLYKNVAQWQQTR
jgi:hypothetical protein